MTGAEVKKFREVNGLTQRELGMMVGTNQPFIYRIEIGDRKGERVCKSVEKLENSKSLFDEKMKIVEAYRRARAKKKEKPIPNQLTPEQVKFFREEHGLSRIELALMVGCKNSSVRGFENGGVRVSKIPKIVKELMNDTEKLAIEIKKAKEYIPEKHSYTNCQKSFEEYNAKLLHFSREADKLGLSYGNYIAMRRGEK